MRRDLCLEDRSECFTCIRANLRYVKGHRHTFFPNVIEVEAYANTVS